jgi:hypothetical protein
LSDDAANNSCQFAGAAGCEEYPVVFLRRRAIEGRNVSRTKPRKIDEVECKLHAHCFVRGGLNTCTQRIEESCNFAGKHSSNPNIAVEFERPGGDVGPVAELFGHAQYPRFGAGTYSAASMQGTIHCADRGSQGFRDVANASRFAVFVCRPHLEGVHSFAHTLVGKAMKNRF